MRLLVVDWDFFFPTKPIQSGAKEWLLYDWGHRETTFFIDGPVWYHRAAAFLVAGLSLPNLSGEERTFWRRFTFDKETNLYVTDSNVWAASDEVMDGIERFSEVWLYDAHHDCGYPPQGRLELALKGKTREEYILEVLKTGRYSCEDWMILHFGLGSRLHVRYPSWMTWAEPDDDDMILPPHAVDRQIDDGSNGPKGRFDRVFVCRSGAWVPPWHDRAFRRFIDRAPLSLKRVALDPTVMRPRQFDLLDVERAASMFRAHGRVSADHI